jgi:hypothetical protein
MNKAEVLRYLLPPGQRPSRVNKQELDQDYQENRG